MYIVSGMIFWLLILVKIGLNYFAVRVRRIAALLFNILSRPVSLPYIIGMFIISVLRFSLHLKFNTI